MRLYALHDKKARALSSFHVERSDAVASRGFAEAVIKDGSVFAKYPQDFELVVVAFLRDDTSDVEPMVVEMSPPLKVVITAEQVLAVHRPPSMDQLSLLKEA